MQKGFDSMTDRIYAFLEEKNAKDRRTRKTIVAIKIALIELLQDKELDLISISELAEKADVNRKTFYNHFESVEDVAEKIREDFSNYILSLLPNQITIQNTIEIYHFLTKLNEIWLEHKDLMRKNQNLLESGFLHQHMMKQLEPYIHKCLTIYKVSEHIIPYISTYILHGIVSIYLAWLDDDSLTIDQLTLLCYNLILSSLHLDNFKDILVEDAASV